MPNITYEMPDGTRGNAFVPEGISLMQGLVQQDVGNIVAECGGSAMCATCHIYVDESQLDMLPPIGEIEDEMLDSTMAERKPNSRLSCQITVTAALEGLTIRFPDVQI